MSPPAFSEAVIAYQSGDHARARRVCERVLKRQTGHFDALYLLGVIAAQGGHMTEAVDCLKRAAAADARHPAVQAQLGAVLQMLGRHEEALDCLNQAIRLKPDVAQTHDSRGNILADLGRHAEAITSYNRATALAPGYADAYNNLGVVLGKLIRHEEAIASFDRALMLEPDFADAHSNRGVALTAVKRLEEALLSFERALAIEPRMADAWHGKALALAALERHDEAIQCFKQAIAFQPEFADAYNNWGSTLFERKQYLAAVERFDRALEIRPGYPFLRGTRLCTLMHVCAWDDFSTELVQLEALIAAGEPASSPFAMVALSHSARLQRHAAERWAREKHLPGAVTAMPVRLPSHGKIRIGYFSPDFREHPVSWLTAELFERHDRSRFEVYGFSFGPNDGSGMRSRLAEAFDYFVEVRAMSDRDIAHRSRGLGIDIAIDLSGYTEGGRTGIFAARAAPVQAGYIGYLGTMGAPFMDYVIADETLIPHADRKHFTEKIAYLPSYQANDTKRHIADRIFTREEVGLPAHGFVFCCFNNNYKITPDTFDGWMRILKRVEGSVLLLYAGNPEAATNLKSEAQRRGVDGTRLIFGGYLPRPEYLARYRMADLFLDTLPYNAGTTASDALWAGLPVLTLLGTTFAGRVAASVLRAAGMPELITTTQQEYEDLAVALAMDSRKLAVIRQKLAANRATMPLFDITSFTRNLEVLYTHMHARRQSELAPEHLHV